MTEFDVRTPSILVDRRNALGRQPAEGGRRARARDKQPKLLVLDQPTRGLDVGSIEFIHNETVERRTAGTAVLLISAELDEVLELSDRIGVMYRGEIVAVVDARTADKEDVGLLMATGGKVSLDDVTKSMSTDLEQAS